MSDIATFATGHWRWRLKQICSKRLELVQFAQQTEEENFST